MVKELLTSEVSLFSELFQVSVVCSVSEEMGPACLPYFFFRPDLGLWW